MFCYHIISTSYPRNEPGNISTMIDDALYATDEFFCSRRETLKEHKPTLGQNELAVRLIQEICEGDKPVV